jgi:hypothetical protein
MKMTFLLFCVIILNDTRFFSTSFAVHCCLVWCVGVPQSFLRFIMKVNPIYGVHSSQKKNSKPQLKFPLSDADSTIDRNHIFDSFHSLLKPAILTCCARISRTTLASQIHARANKCPTRQRGLVLPDGLATTGSCCSPSGWSRGATTWVNSNTQKIVRFS